MKKIIRKSCAALGAVCAVLFSAIGVAGAGLPEQFDAVKGSAFSLPAYTVRLPRQTGAVSAASLNAGSTYTASLQLFGLFPVKDVTVSVVDSLFVIPCGTPFGIKMYTDGVLVVGLTAVDTAAGSYEPAKAAGIKTGDIIVQINGQPV
ncbi:MAG: PDZ domain-containing protein, partial [Oscillospiraceae bacterium]|nr:PDZ domain-containing protein [Oscillospiraceae bacterium]